MTLQPDQIVTACRCPFSNVNDVWPLVLKALDQFNIHTDLVEIAAAATIAVETAWTFLPVQEKMADPNRQPDLAADQLRYIPYFGRGLLQTTWRANYQKLEPHIPGVVANPDLLLQPENSAIALAFYFANNPTPDHNVATAANAQRWDLVRERVNGGLNGYNEFYGCVQRLQGGNT